uniref:protein ENHANCED PSEUDOMONAS SUSCEPTIBILITY 1-like n=1 Tax=Erigeron canadensis TaxID=72917 RepID=UPI001CB97E88|nr:protein ENHANCED PSEUDOMONAS SUSCEPTIBILITY 1-like [Erigeron canadensis]
MNSPILRQVSECFVKPLHDLSPEKKQPIHCTPFELAYLNNNYSQVGLLFAKPSSLEDQNFSITAFLDYLKNSLSATLTHFYPLAGRLATQKQDNPPSYVIYIDPENSPGVKFIYAKANATISDVLKPAYVPLIVESFFDLDRAINHDGHTLPLVSIKVTELDDGIFIGNSMNHVIADGTSFWHFMTSWSEIFKSKNQGACVLSRYPVFKRQALYKEYDPIVSLPFTHHDQFIERYEHPQVLKDRYFHFSSASIARLKKKANTECNSQKISSLQAVSALLWRCVTRVRRLPADGNTVCTLPVNNRRRVNPPLSDDYFGSPIQTVQATTTVEDLMAHGLGWAAFKLHEAVTSDDDVAVRKWVDSWFKNPVVPKNSSLMFSNMLQIGGSPRFDTYGCDFGLGKAIAVRSGHANKADGRVAMYPVREGDGSMDVKVCLLPKTMKDLECDKEFICALNWNFVQKRAYL